HPIKEEGEVYTADEERNELEIKVNILVQFATMKELLM
ncbi:unnamed protein product, partial [Allacma fusca]